VVAWGDQLPSLLKGGESRGRVSVADVAKRRDAADATFAPDAHDRCAVSRAADLDETVTWRIIYRLDPDAIVLLGVFEKKTKETPRRVIDVCKERIRNYES
jgi:Phage derived protein Gp49-like (DUF891).